MSDPRRAERAIDEAVRRTRREALAALAEWTRTIGGRPFEQEIVVGDRVEWRPSRAPVRSVLLTAARYTNDDGGAEVDLDVVVSPNETPTWPHDCRDEADGGDGGGCGLCANLDPPSWGEGHLVPAFAPFCHERGTQDRADVENARPLAIARVGDGGAVSVEVVGRLVRPWLDLPRAPELPVDDDVARLAAAARDDAGARAVLADLLEERGDPRGELITLASIPSASDAARARYEALLAEAGRAWLGAWDAHVPRAGLRFEGGLPSEIELWIAPGGAPARGDRAERVLWSLARSVRFLPTSARVVRPSMAPLRALGPLDDEALAAIGESDLPFAVEELEVEPSSPHALEALRTLDELLPRLRLLRVVGAAAGRALIPLLRRWPRLATLAHLEVAGAWDIEEQAAEVAAWHAAGLGVPVRVAQLDEDTRR